jgi:subtilisin-like proprotein convertase family protein
MRAADQSAFDGQDPEGTWTLTIGDTAEQDTHCFYNVDIAVTVTCRGRPARPSARRAAGGTSAPCSGTRATVDAVRL